MSVEVIKTFSTACYGALHEAIATDAAIVPVLEQIVISTGTTTSFFFDVALSTTEDAALDSLLSSWVCPTSLVPTIDNASLTDGIGIIIPLSFNYESTAKNKWLSHEGDNSLSSDDVPAVIPFTCKLVGITFSNSISDADTDLEIYYMPKNDTTRTNVCTWNIRSTKTGHKTNQQEVIFEAGSKIGVYLRDKGTNVKKVVVILYIQMLQLIQEENTESYTTSDSGY